MSDSPPTTAAQILPVTVWKWQPMSDLASLWTAESLLMAE